VVAAGTSVAPPERPAHLQAASVLPSAPTISSSRARIDREPKITAAKATTPSDDEDASSNSDSNHSTKSQDHSEDHDINSDSGTDDDSDSDINASSAKTPAAHVRIGPPSRSKPKQPVTATADTTNRGILDVEMHSPPHAQPSQQGRARNVKVIGSSSHPQPVKSSGASKPYGGTIGGRAFGNAPNIGDFDLVEDNSPFNDVEGTVNLFPSNT